MILNRRRFDISRAKAQMTITDLTKLSGCNRSKFCGKKPITLSVLAAGRVASALGVDLEYLVEDEPAEVNK